MAWTVPKTWTVGEVVRSYYLNQQVRDNMDALGKNGAIRVGKTNAESFVNNTNGTLTFNTEQYKRGAVGNSFGPILDKNGYYRIAAGFVGGSVNNHIFMRIEIELNGVVGQYRPVQTNAPVIQSIADYVGVHCVTDTFAFAGTTVDIRWTTHAPTGTPLMPLYLGEAPGNCWLAVWLLRET